MVFEQWTSTFDMISFFNDGIIVISRNFFGKKEVSSKLPVNNGDTYMGDDIFCH